MNIQQANKIHIESNKLIVPPTPIIPFIEGQGIGPEVWHATRKVLDAAVNRAYNNNRSIAWLPVELTSSGSWDLTKQALLALKEYHVSIKGPLSTPIGGGYRSLTVALRKALDLYICQRPVRWIPGVPTPVQQPHLVDMVIFRENTEDLYAGIEYELGSPELETLKHFLAQHLPESYRQIRFPQTSAIGLKPISLEGSIRLVRAAITWALENKRKSVTLVHKGNIMKFTEGAFRNWGYEIAESEFGANVYSMQQWARTKDAEGETAANLEMQKAVNQGKLLIKDRITDAMFEAALTHPQDYDVLATTNLNGDLLSDALAAQVGGLGISPGANINYQTYHALFEATHGTAPDLAGKNSANPSSLILSGEMMLRFLGWDEAASLVKAGIENTIAKRILTPDLQTRVNGAVGVSTNEFSDAVIQNMQ